MTGAILRRGEQFVIEAVSREFSAQWNPGDDPPDAYICFGGETIAVEISTLMQPVTDKDGTRAKIGDDLGTGALGDNLNSELSTLIPDGWQIVLATQAPIYQKGKTKKQLSKYLRGLLRTTGGFPAQHCVQINENRFDIYFDEGALTKKVNIGWMHRNVAFDYGDDTRLALKDRIEDKAWKCRNIFACRQVWLALFNDFWFTDAHMYRYALSKLKIEHPFSKILLVSKSGLVETIF